MSEHTVQLGTCLLCKLLWCRTWREVIGVWCHTFLIASCKASQGRRVNQHCLSIMPDLDRMQHQVYTMDWHATWTTYDGLIGIELD
jgi:hypothetical protein